MQQTTSKRKESKDQEEDQEKGSADKFPLRVSGKY